MFKPRMFLGTAVVALSVTACGGSTSSSGGSHPKASNPASTTSTAAAPASTPATHTVNLSTNPSGALMFSATTLHALAGRVTIHFTNKAPEGHNFTLQEGSGGRVLAATPTFNGGTKTLVVNLKPGSYTYFCSVPGHRASGMHGILMVS
jgi:plastocyanin